MANETTVLKSIIDFLFGHKYYVNIINLRGTNNLEMTSFIHYSREDAERHRDDINATSSFLWIETVSFRSRKDYRAKKITNNNQQ